MSTSQPWMTNLANAVRVGLSALFKEPPMTVVEWADKHFYLSSESSYQEGRWTTAPFQVAILNAMGNDLIREVNFVKSARLGYTKMLMAFIGYLVQHKKRNVLMYCPTEGDAEGVMKRHIEGMIRDVPVVLDLAPWYGMKHRDNTLEAKCFANRKMLWCLGGKAARNYREKSPDTVIYDELSKFDEDIEGEGAPTFLGDKRLEGATFKKSIRGSTPTEAEKCQITRASIESPHDLRFSIKAPCCGNELVVHWGGKDEPSGIKWRLNNRQEVEAAWFLCPHCQGGTFEYHEMVTAAAETGRWICQRSGIWTRDSMEWFDASGEPTVTPRSVTFSVWTGYSTFTTWVDIATDFVKVGKDRGKLKTFVNTTLGETWEEDLSEKIDAELLYERREVYGSQVPQRALVLTGGIDTQDDRYELRVWAFGKHEEKWLVYRRVLTGDPASTELLRQVGLELHRQFTRADGTKMGVMRWCWDSGGHHSETVRAQSRKHGLHWVIPIFGASTYGKPIANFPRKKDKKSKTYLTEVGTDNAKEVLYNRLKLQPDGNRPVPGLIHFPADDLICDMDELKQLTSETKKWVLVKGRRVLRWDASKKRNEALDCLVYALAALRISQERFGLDLDLLASQNPETGVWEVPEEPAQAAEPDEPPAPAALPPPAPVAPQPDHQPAAGGWVETGASGWLT
ncbi:phage terminase large subunit family protein [Pseudomonas juntendi]|uniref:phage terminase large subunit family protein n=1 Tax=Pseudomonas juntendi TaxID=2666183 RepID=UPI00244AA887|nr:terminase gpA endonuclease subunit [Pseudomonas juntendi]MDG9891216.1 phage terminase large subunit family protein [Pseudomonas juntendi]